MVSTSSATSFGGWAFDYHDWRPTYPDAAVDWLLLLRGMLDLIGRRHPDLRTHEADSTHFPLSRHSVDAVLVADAWHWFPKEESSAEVVRVLRPGGWRGFVSTVSHVRLRPEDERRAALDETERLVALACAEAGTTSVPLAHDAVCPRWRPGT